MMQTVQTPAQWEVDGGLVVNGKTMSVVVKVPGTGRARYLTQPRGSWRPETQDRKREVYIRATSCLVREGLAQ